MLFVIIALAIVATVFVIFKKKIDKSSSTPTHPPAEEVTPPTHEIPDYIPTPRALTEPLDVVITTEVVPTTPPSAPTMVAKKKKKPQPKKKPAKTNA